MKAIRKVLMIDDEREICVLLCAMLKRSGAQCRFAHTLEQGRDLLQEGSFDAVFLDVHLPDGLGYDLIPNIKTTAPETTCIAMSAIEGEGARAQELGADTFISKPFDRASIFDRLRELGFSA
ncbi:MAG: response regulator [Flavobacteriales bacterium]|nr:MAG: response regulator [Flavobacteriales bacterium]